PVVKAQAVAADQRQITGARGVRHHGHRWNGREAGNTIGTVGFGSVDVGGGDNFIHLVPMGTHKSTQTTALFVVLGFGRALNNRAPGINRISKLLARFAPKANQFLPDFRVFQAVSAVDIPGETRTTRTAARLVVRQVRTGTWI